MPDLRWIKALSQQVCKLVWWRQGFNKHLGASHRRSEAILYVLMKTQIEEEVCISNCSRLVAEPGGEWGKSNFLSIFFFFSSSNYFSNVLEPVLIYECFSEAAYSSVQVIVALVLSMKVDKNIGNDIWEQQMSTLVQGSVAESAAGGAIWGEQSLATWGMESTELLGSRKN